MTSSHTLRVHVLAGRYAVCRLEPNAPIPDWARGPGFVSITRTSEELSVVCDERSVPRGTRVEDGYALLMVQGPLAHEMVGVMVALITPLAGAGIPIFAISTFDTDYVLVRATHLDRALTAIREAGHTVA